MTPIIKPKYNGSFVGQVFRTNGQVITKRTAYEFLDKENNSFETKYGKVSSQQYIELIWDGKDWISKRDFNLKFMRKRTF